MLRLQFTDADLRRTTLAPGPNAVLETALSVRRLRVNPGNQGRSEKGLQQLRQQMNGGLADRAGVLLELIPAEGSLPDFLLPLDAPDIDGGIEAINQAPVEQLAADMSVLPLVIRTSPWSRELAAGAKGARRTLATALHTYFNSSLAPIWPLIQERIAADRSLRAETLLRGGLDALLTTLNVHWHWDPPVLHIPRTYSYDVPLCGRGLLLVPSYFASTPMLAWRPTESTVLVYPICHLDERAEPTDVLGPLLGRTRAAVLAALRDPATTTALADRVRVSLASASQHATALRNAGLVSTTRIGGAVLHALTPLGAALLRRNSTAD